MGFNRDTDTPGPSPPFGLAAALVEARSHADSQLAARVSTLAKSREVEVALLFEMREPEFGILLMVSITVAVAAAILVGVWLRWYRNRRVAILTAELESARCAMYAELGEKRSAAISRLTRTLVGVMERHYPGAAVSEIEAATGLRVDTTELLAGERDDVIIAFAERHLSADPVCASDL
ncbi:MAG: hypothetical protein U1E26_02370 [Coriobacteriia bacterium]|nr:hypothetical protein [Coriobacteriia bacterium]